MKKLHILFFILSTNILYSQHIKRDVYEIHECIYNQNSELVCDKELINYEIIINNDLLFIYVLNKIDNTKIFSMDIVDYNQVNEQLWLYELNSENDTKYSMSYDIKRQTIILFPVYNIFSKNIRLSSIILRFKNPIKI